MTEYRLATTDWADQHVASCQDTRCWYCATYRRVLPAEYAQAVARGRATRN